jgi:GNAT superfamily N-acetyltransferase
MTADEVTAPDGRGDATPHQQVTLVPVTADRAGAALAGKLSGFPPGEAGALRAGRGWPHDDTPHALAFTEVGGLTWLIVDATGAVVGELGTKGPPSAQGHVEIGYGLAAPSRSRGLGTAAVRDLVAVLGSHPDISILEAHVALDNLPSQRLLERLGFTCVGSDHSELHYRLEVGTGSSGT